MWRVFGNLPFLVIGGFFAWLSPLGRGELWFLLLGVLAGCWWLLAIEATMRRFYLGLWRIPPLPIGLAMALLLWPTGALLGRWVAGGDGPRIALIAGAVLLGLRWVEVPTALVVLAAYLTPDRGVFLLLAVPALAAGLAELVIGIGVDDWWPPRIQRAIKAGHPRRARAWALTMAPLALLVSAETREDICSLVGTVYWTTGLSGRAMWWERWTVNGPRRRGNIGAYLIALRNVAGSARTAGRYDEAVGLLVRAGGVAGGPLHHYLTKVGKLGPDAIRLRTGLHKLDLAKELARTLRDKGDLSGAVAETDRGLALVGSERPAQGLLGEPADPESRRGLRRIYVELMQTRAQLAGAYLHDERLAERLLLTALASTEAFGDDEVAEFAGYFLNAHYGDLLNREGRYDEAEDRYRRAGASGFQVGGPDQGLVPAGASGSVADLMTMSLANLARMRGDLDTAERLYRQALLGISAPQVTVGFSIQVLVGLSDVLAKRGEIAEALGRGGEAVRLAELLNNEMMLRNSLLYLGKIEEKAGEDEAAARHYARAIEVMETLRGGLAGEEHRIAFVGGNRRIESYERLVALNLRLGRHVEAFNYAERGKARAILDRLGAGHGDAPTSYAEIRDLLGQAGRAVVVIEFFVCGDRLAAFAVRADAEIRATMLDVDHDELRRFALANFGVASRVRDMTVLGLEEMWYGFDALVAPLAEWSRPGDVVVFVPHGILHYLPLHTLRLAGEPLIKRNPIGYAPSASVLRLCRRAEPDLDGKVAVVGDPREDLWQARIEATSVAELFDTEPLLGSAVTATAFAELAAGATLVHYAGHAVFDADEAMASGLLLAGGEVLRASDVQDLPGLRPRMVTLSGCETGVSKRHPGDELMGLTRAFLYAGASTVVASLWRVADASTAHLMRAFYDRLVRGDAAVDALRGAMLETASSAQWSSLYHWAPFLVIGDWE